MVTMPSKLGLFRAFNMGVNGKSYIFSEKVLFEEIWSKFFLINFTLDLKLHNLLNKKKKMVSLADA